MKLIGPGVRILEVHPGLDSSLLRHAVADAAALGYNTLRVAGGNSLPDSYLEEICREAHRWNMLAVVETHGAAIELRRPDPLRKIGRAHV
jgi:hypothetical protein